MGTSVISSQLMTYTHRLDLQKIRLVTMKIIDGGHREMEWLNSLNSLNTFTLISAYYDYYMLLTIILVDHYPDTLRQSLFCGSLTRPCFLIYIIP